jgi:hypothetical protein
MMQFDDMSDAFRWMEDQTNAANAALAPEQRSLSWGSTWVRFYAPYRLVIFGRVHEMEDVLSAERRLGADAGEIEWQRNRLIANHERGYLMGTAWSSIEPRGEDGDTHRANAWPCSPEMIEEARAVQWDQHNLPERAIRELALIFVAWRAHLGQ